VHPPLELPARFNGLFGLVLYYQQHGVLLLRSGDRDDGGPRRIDLLLFRVDIDRTLHYIIAGGVFASRDDRSYFDPSPLLPEIEVQLKFDAE
jgi:hypothetical protein